VKDQAAVGQHWISVSALLRRLQLDEPLEEIRSHIGGARMALEQGDDDWAITQLDFVEGLLRRMLDSS
jgi:phosphoglycerate-specific signal transduction histidine kinase